MKKFLTFICAITCIFGLTACGSDPVYNDYEEYKLQYAEQNATYLITDVIEPFTKGGYYDGSFDDYSASEIGAIISDSFPFETDGFTFLGAVSSFNSGKETIGDIVELGEMTSKIDGDRVIVDVEVIGSQRKAEAEIIFDKNMVIDEGSMIFRLESASLNPEMSKGELMGKAALNTLVGMGTVFAVLLFISFIISLFKLIPKIQESFEKKKKTQDAGADGTAKTVQIETSNAADTVDESDDLELVAVIAAAIASYEGQSSTDGFVVRSIRKRTAR